MEAFLEKIYPLTIIKDRYGGTYSGGEYTAWKLDFDEIPPEAAGDDANCYDFWKKNKTPVGKGDSIREAVLDLYIQLKKGGE